MQTGINFLFGIHIHQPVGNFDYVFQKATKECYYPLLKTLAQHPTIKFSLHISGPVLEYFQEKYPKIISLIQTMSKSGQVEMWSGGFYEPVLVSIPERDAKAQIEMMNEFIHINFGQHPSGLWLTERIWEPHLPSLLNSSNLDYVVVDDYHFKSVGISGEKLFSHFISEHNNQRVNIFPISEKLRYLIPFAPVSDLFQYLKEISDASGKRLAIYADDGEKFGLWPGTYNWVYREKWLEKFLSELERNSSWVKSIHFSEAISNIKPSGIAYLPTGSYFEMNEWTLPSEIASRYKTLISELKERGTVEEFKPIIKGGHWRNFMSKYPESNFMHKIMYYLSRRYSELSEDMTNNVSDIIKRAIFRSQCNCAYWHGVFGGLYLPHLREGIYQNLIEAEKQLDKFIKEDEKNWIELDQQDIDMDGRDEVIVRSPYYSAYIKPSYGGSIFSLFHKEANFNLTNTLKRYPEAYHSVITNKVKKEKKGNGIDSIHDIQMKHSEDLEAHLIYDWHQRYFLQEHIIDKSTELEMFRKCKYAEYGDFVNQPYKYNIDSDIDGVYLDTFRDGGIWIDGNRTGMNLKKSYTFLKGKAHFNIDYRIECTDPDICKDKYLGVEMNLGLMSRDNPDVFFRIPGIDNNISAGEHLEVRGLNRIDLFIRFKGIELSIDSQSDCRLWLFPVETISLSESGYERVFQETVLLFLFDLNNLKENPFRNKITVSFIK